MLRLRVALLFIAVLSAGIGAGFFLTYANTIMPGLATTDDRTFVSAFQGLERVFGPEIISNWPVMFSFIGGPLFIVAAIVLNRRNRQVAGLASLALVLLLTVIAITFTITVPRNNQLSAAGNPNEINVTQVRQDFGEDTWRTWNNVRSTTSSLAFICLAIALYLAGREENRK